MKTYSFFKLCLSLLEHESLLPNPRPFQSDVPEELLQKLKKKQLRRSHGGLCLLKTRLQKKELGKQQGWLREKNRAIRGVQSRILLVRYWRNNSNPDSILLGLLIKKPPGEGLHRYFYISLKGTLKFCLRFFFDCFNRFPDPLNPKILKKSYKQRFFQFFL